MKRLQKMVWSIALGLGTVVYADYSLVGIEMGYGSLNYDVTNSNVTPALYGSDSQQYATIGAKIGAENENMRILLSARYGDDFDDYFDYMTNLEVEADYLFNVSSDANIFVGIHGGRTYMKYSVIGESFSRTISESYYGGNLGVNIHAQEDIDIEIGSRFSVLDAQNLRDGVLYDFTDKVAGYLSIIFKY